MLRDVGAVRSVASRCQVESIGLLDLAMGDGASPEMLGWIAISLTLSGHQSRHIRKESALSGLLEM